ncbi:hypothetical protein ABZ700_04665 [Streptomyces diastaticus]|uniref:hypothetical protein n=1 Tax=Streptomyces diastaticus TaxID=1956 RepID=UPI0033F67B51
MAQFGCGGPRCTCLVTAGPGVVVTGNGSAGAPYVVEAGVAPVSCDDVRPCLSAGPGATYDPATGVIGAEPTVVEAGDRVTVTGDGTTADPYVVAADPVSCDDVRPCFSAGPGATYDPDTGVIGAERTVVEAGTNVTVTGDGTAADPYVVNSAGGDGVATSVEGGDGVTVTGAGTVTDPYVVSAEPPVTGCGLTGDGTAGAPLAVATAAWPYDCPPEDSGTVVVCDTDGVLRGEPRGQVSFVSYSETRDYPDLEVPTGTTPTDVDTPFTLEVTNPDPCLPALVLVEREADVDFDLPVGAGAGYAQDTDEMVYLRNTGTTAIQDTHVQTTKLYQHTLSLAPGATATVNFPVRLSRGAGGATYNRIQVFIRALLISQ